MELAMEIIDKEYKHHKMRSVQKVLNENRSKSNSAVAVHAEGTKGEASTEGTATAAKQEQDQKD
jgi:hypothetical protein